MPDGENDEVFEEAVSIAASYACTIETQDSLLDLLFVGTRASREVANYPDIDLRAERDGKDQRYLHKSGEPYPGSER